MGLWNTVRGRLKARKRRKTRDAIFVALDEARRAAVRREITVDDRVVIFSDRNKGARDGADDFQRCERAYNAALVYYHYLGWHLVELGDVEELWENTIGGHVQLPRDAAARRRVPGRRALHALLRQPRPRVARRRAVRGEHGGARLRPR